MKDIIEQCARIAESEPEPGAPTPQLLAQLKHAGVVNVGQAAIAVTKRNIARRIRELNRVQQ